MQINEATGLEAERLARRNGIKAKIARFRQVLADRGYPLPDDATDEEVIVTVQNLDDVMSGRVQPPAGYKVDSCPDGKDRLEEKGPGILH